MMNINCSIIKDLLPLYIDNITSEESNKLIEDHLQECKECKEVFNIMKEENKVSSIDEKKAMKKFFEKIKKKRLITILLSIILTMFFTFFIWIIFNKRDFLIKYKEDLLTVEEQEDGEILFNVNTLNYSTCQMISKENYDGSIDIYITLYQTLIDKFYETGEFKEFHGAPKRYKDYIKENIEINVAYENNKGKITLKPQDDIKIANIYYLENKEEFDTILNSNEITDSLLEQQKIWSNE